MKYCLFSWLLLVVVNSSSQTKIHVENTADVVRHDELVKIPRPMLEKKFGKSAGHGFFEIKLDGRVLPSQNIDEDGDGNWDTVVFLDNFKPRETKTYQATPTPAVSNTTSYAHARLKPKVANDSFGPSVASLQMPFQNPPNDFSKSPLPPYLTEGPALENDKNAFRLYFDTRNTQDIYGKRQPRLVMDSVGSNTRHSYHHLSDWGMDILHVEKSLGAGSLALLTKDVDGNDTLVRLGGKDIVKETYKLLNDGPIYASYQMDYLWKVSGTSVEIKEVMCIWKGQYFYESKVTMSRAPANSVLVAGIADFYQNKMDSIKEHAVTTLYSFGKQSENKDELGLAVMAAGQDVAFLGDAPRSNSDVTCSHLLGEKIIPGKSNQFRFYSCWTMTNGQIANSAAAFRDFLKNEMVKFSSPLRIFRPTSTNRRHFSPKTINGK